MFQKLEYWDEHVCLCAENMRDNLKILHKALKENKISLMVHNVSRNFINKKSGKNAPFYCGLAKDFELFVHSSFIKSPVKQIE